MKKTLYAICLAAALSFAVAAVSSAADAKIGTVDTTRVLMESKAGQAGMKAVETMFNNKQAEFDQRQQEVKQQLDDLDKQSMLISPDEKKQRQDKLQKDIRDLQRFKEDSETELNKKRDEMVSKMSKEVKAVLETYGKQEGYTLILERSVVLYAPDAVDITDKIIAAYDKSKGIQ